MVITFSQLLNEQASNSIVSDEDIEFLSKDKELRDGFNAFKNLYTQGKTLRSDFSGIQKYNLSMNEAKVIFAYTFGGYNKLNQMLLRDSLDSVYSKYSELLQRVLGKLPSYKGIVYRIMDDATDYTSGMETNWKVFSSCSKSSDVFDYFSGNRKFIIDCDNGKDISNIAIYADEQEVVLLPSKFKVISNDGDTVTLKQI